MNSTESKWIGQPLDRTDGALKVTGSARYAGDVTLPGLCHAVLVQSTVAQGRIVAMDVTRAEHAPGVRFVMTHANAPRLPDGGRAAVNPPAGRVLSLLQDDMVHYHGQPIAVVIAASLEQATAAASLVRVTYSTAVATLNFDQAKSNSYQPKKAGQADADKGWGDAKAALAAAAVTVEATYSTPMQTHNPMEPHATVAHWEGAHLTLYDSTQYITGVQKTVAKVLGIDPEAVRVVSPFVGGGFGCKGSVWSHVVLAAMAARKLQQPVKLVLTRPQMFGPVGGRPETEQRIVLGAQADGQLTAMQHEVVSHTSAIEDFVEPSAIVTRMLYACRNVSTAHRLTQLNVGTPTFQRAPGEATGSFALEVAMDELAYKLGIDPLELRERNYAETEPESGKPFSSKQLRDCYRDAAARFGWSTRPPRPRSMHDGPLLRGWGMATATYPANRSPASASAVLFPDGLVMVKSGSQDIGTGTYTVMTQVAAETLGMPIHTVRFELGDTTFPEAPVSGGSTTAASVSPAVQAACLALRQQIAASAVADRASPLYGAAVDQIDFVDGWLSLRASSTKERVASVAARQGKPIEANAHVGPGDEKSQHSLHSFGAVFVEVAVDEDIGQIRVPRVVATYDVGRLLNVKTARSQIQGGIVWGISLALQEHSILDLNTGRFVNANLSEYHVPVNADIQSLEVNFIEVPDLIFNPLGVRGVGEIGITGVAAAICNALYHATGVRVRQLPITVDKLLS